MGYELTDEQKTVVNEILKPATDKQPIVINAVAGAAKSTTIHTAITKLIEQDNKTKIRLMVFGKANAVEAKKLLPKEVEVTTVHALAYKHTVKPLKLKLPIRSRLRLSDMPKSIPIPKEFQKDVIELAEKFLESNELSVKEYVKTINEDNDFESITYTEDTVKYTNIYLNLLSKGKINITHQFYLKLFHIKILNETIKLEPVDILVNEEAQDFLQVMIDVADKQEATKKIYIGDMRQSLLSFTGAANVMEHFLENNIGNRLFLTKSFRVSVKNARAVQEFMREHVEEDFIIEGFDKPIPDKPTYAYLTRTNTALVDKMVDLCITGTEFNLSNKTKVAQLFDLPLALATAKKGGKMYNSDNDYIQKLIDEAPGIDKEKILNYVKAALKNNNTVVQAINLVLKYDTSVLFETYKVAKQYSESKIDYGYMLSTAYTAKGFGFTHVEISEDLEIAVQKVLDKALSERKLEDKEILNLAYVAFTRATHSVTGSKIFNKFLKESEDV